MKKVRGQIKKIEGDKASIQYDGSDIMLPSSLLGDFSVGDTVVITILSEKEDTKDSNEVARSLLADILKED